jgi:hypothetical protein
MQLMWVSLLMKPEMRATQQMPHQKHRPHKILEWELTAAAAACYVQLFACYLQSHAPAAAAAALQLPSSQPLQPHLA